MRSTELFPFIVYFAAVVLLVITMLVLSWLLGQRRANKATNVPFESGILPVGLFVIMLNLTGLDFLTSMSAAGTAISNVGPGLGETIGPSGNFKELNDVAKWLLSAAMLVGRLELFTVLVLFMPRFWRA